MLTRLSVEDLVRGMFVESLDCSWTKTPFPFQGFLIRSEQDLAELRHYCQYVFINEKKSRLDEEGRQTLDRTRRTGGRSSSISHIEFEPWEGAARLRQTLENIERLKTQIDDELSQVYAEVAQKSRVDPMKIAVVAEAMYRALEKEPRIGKWVAQMQTRDASLAEHCRNVALLAMGFARHLGIPDRQVPVIGQGALLHDIGLARVPNEILDRAGPLSPREARLVRLHPEYAVSCLESYARLPVETVEIIEQHHYRLDGSGYPEAIPHPVQNHVFIVAICDVFEKMTSYRSYRRPFAPEEALVELDRMGRSQFPTELVQDFIAWLGIYPRGNFVMLENGAIGVVVSSSPGFKTRPVLRMLRTAGGQLSPETYIDLSLMSGEQRESGWRIVKSIHPMNMEIVGSLVLSAS